MMRWKPTLAALVTPGLLFTGVAWATAASGPATQRLVESNPSAIVTLVSGDRVTVLDSSLEHVSVQPGAGRAGVRFVTRRVAGHLQVIPNDAMALLRDQRLDVRLFDVAQLMQVDAAGAGSALPLIVTYPTAGERAAGRAAVAMTGAKPGRDLPAAGGFAVKVAKADLTAFWGGVKNPGVPSGLTAGHPKVWLDGIRKPTLDVSVPMIGGPAARQAGLDGAGVRVAVLDTGIDATHPDLERRVTVEENFTDGVEDNRDLAGHGTHVASTIAGDGVASGGRYIGVAPGAQLLDGKVCVVDGCADSWILAGMQWAADQGANVVNLSLGGYDSAEVDPLEQAVETLTAQYGTLFVVAAGNDGADRSINSPASAGAALAVSAVTKSDQLADFSSRGPRAGDWAVKPDLTAPGVDIVAARSKDGSIGEPAGDDRYLRLSGTSMATPHVSGAAAALKQQHPQWSAEQLKAALMGAAKPNPALSVFAEGAGRLDLARAINQPVLASPASLSFGEQRWPHNDDRPTTTSVSYRNDGPRNVTLSLDVAATGPDGRAAPAGMFTLSRSTLTVPAGGQAQATVTADTRAGAMDGTFTGALTATGDGVEVRSPLAVTREVESYDLTLAHTERDGAPSSTHFTHVYPLGPGFRFEDIRSAVGPASTVTLRLPKGSYLVDSTVIDADGETMLIQPTIDLNTDREVGLDARLGKPIAVNVSDPSATSVWAEVTAWEHLADGSRNISTLAGSSFSGMFTARIGPDVGAGPVSTAVSSRWAHSGPNGTITDSPVTYLLAWFDKGRMATGFHRKVTVRETAAVHADYGSQADGVLSWNEAFATSPDGEGPVWFFPVPFHAPFARTVHYNTDGGLRWSPQFVEGLGISDTTAAPTTYQAGREYTERWNRGVFGPSFGVATREADVIFTRMGLYGDGIGRSGFSATAAQHVTLTLDGVPVPIRDDPEGVRFTVAPEAGTYRLQIDADRGAPATLSIRTTAAWTFRSAHTAADTRLPLSVIRFGPQLDALNTAPAGRLYAVPVTVTPQPNSTATLPSTLTVDVSYDDGATWQTAPLHRAGDQAIATLQHPDHDGFVSLRASSTDTSGNTVKQTIIRAYHIAR